MKKIENQAKIEISETKIIDLQEICNKPLNDKLSFMANFANENNPGLQGARIEALKVSNKFMKVFNKSQKKTNFKPYLNADVQKLVNNEPLPDTCFGIMSIQNQSEIMENQQTTVVNVSLGKSQMERLKTLVF